jgi:hypothetical protein
MAAPASKAIAATSKPIVSIKAGFVLFHINNPNNISGVVIQ